MPNNKIKLLTRQGYAIQKKNIDEKQLDQIKEELHIELSDNFSNKKNVEYDIFIENEKTIVIPKLYGEKYFYNFKTINKLNSLPINITFTKEIRDYQLQIVKKCMSHFKKSSSGLIVLSCGLGKTCIALYLACVLKLKTLVIVDRGFLQNQWIERIQTFTNASYGLIRGDNVDISKDIVVGMVQSISKRNYPADLFNQFGFVIFDECHTVASQIFCKSLRKTCSKYNIGLTATPYRKDDLMKVVKWYLGEPIVNMSRMPTNNVIVKCFYYYPEKDIKCFKLVTRKVKGMIMPMTPTMTNNICECNERNEFIISLVLEIGKSNRKILLLGERNNHIKLIKHQVELKNGSLKTSLYIGKMKQENLEESSKASLIFSNYKMASTGLDIDGLDTLIFINGRKDVVQSVGRILRKPLMKGMNIPLIIDIIDIFSCYSKWGDTRKKYYSKQKYTIQHYGVYGSTLCNPRTLLKKKNIINSGEKHSLNDLKTKYSASFDFDTPFATFGKKEFLHSNKLSTVLKNNIATENETIKVVNNLQ